VQERLNWTVSKTVVPETVPWVRIPPLPPNIQHMNIENTAYRYEAGGNAAFGLRLIEPLFSKESANWLNDIATRL
jgi:hypothetical protein